MSTTSDGRPPRPKLTVPLSVPCLQGNEWEYIKDCLDTNWVSSVGSYVDSFERKFADFVGCRFAVATVNGTAALHTALLVAGIQPGDEVLVSSLSFIAPANAIRYVGARPVFIDAEPDYWQLDSNLVRNFLKQHCRRQQGVLRNVTTGRPVRGIIPVHILGHPVEIDTILELADEYGLVVIEDAAESLGAEYRGRMVGTFGRMACFSFNGNKTITTGGGGILATDDEALAAKARYLTTQARDDALEYRHHEVGYNYRMPNILAAMGCAQIEQLPDYLRKKRQIARTYANRLADIPGIRVLEESPSAHSAHWMSAVELNSDAFGMHARTLRNHMRDRGIETRMLWQPLCDSPAHKNRAVITSCDVARSLHQDCLCLPSSVGLEDAEMNLVVGEIRRARRASDKAA